MKKEFPVPTAFRRRNTVDGAFPEYPGGDPSSFQTYLLSAEGREFRASAPAWLVCWCPTAACLSDPAGFQRLEDGYNSAGQHFWSPKAYKAGQVAAKWRIPILLGLPAVLLACLASLIRVSIY